VHNRDTLIIGMADDRPF